MEPLIAWTFVTLMTLSPYAKQGAKYETEAEYEERVASIARDMVEVVERSEPLPGLTKAETLALVITTAEAESGGFRFDVDKGLPSGLGDHGQSFCIMQIRARSGTVRTHDPVAKRWTGADLIADRQKCLAAGVAMLRDSMLWCKAKGAKEGALISAYTVGKCRANEPVAARRWALAKSARFARCASLNKHRGAT